MKSNKKRSIRIPKIDWSKPLKPVNKEITADVKDELIECISNYTNNNNIVNIERIKEELRALDFHFERPDIFKAIENLAVDCEINHNEITPIQFVNYINNQIFNISNRQCLSILYNSIKDEKKGIILPKNLKSLLDKNYSLEDIEKIMTVIAEPDNNINIDEEQFYFIMSKNPEEAVKINKITKGID